ALPRPRPRLEVDGIAPQRQARGARIVAHALDLAATELCAHGHGPPRAIEAVALEGRADTAPAGHAGGERGQVVDPGPHACLVGLLSAPPEASIDRDASARCGDDAACLDLLGPEVTGETGSAEPGARDGRAEERRL